VPTKREIVVQRKTGNNTVGTKVQLLALYEPRPNRGVAMAMIVRNA